MADPFVSHVRSPLSEASNRLNSAQPSRDGHHYKSRHDQSIASNNARHARRSNQTSAPHGHATHHRHAQQHYHNQPQPQPQHQHQHQHRHHHNHQPATRRSPNLRPPREVDENRRLSQNSYESTSSSRSKAYKTHVGPWQLGKTLGKGSSARVRLCRHNITNQLAAVKIVNRRMAYLVQDSSLAALSKWDSSLPEHINGEMRVPMAIEREVAILKLIEHPNIMKLYDIWENRSEVYLILEYIDQGDLFTFINMKGRLSEELAIYFFRQMISAITYCHSFKICHRDLKPENILITADLQIKIADFGMAALHQTDTHQLVTACGSPHYAAPELLKNRQYRGDRADIWSMGVILFAMLSATLPFDDPDLRVMMSRTKKGHYEMPQFISMEAKDLINRMLQTNPDRRITLREIWRHPLIQKYAYLDNLGDDTGLPPDTRKGFQYSPVPPHDVDPQLLRQLRSMWHMFSESDLKLKLTCSEPNDQKAFYWLLYGYREKQLEDFKPELAHSMSDYHHLKPGAWKKKRVSTCEFSSPRGNGHGRSISRFTVISNAADGSRTLQRGDSQLNTSNTNVRRHYRAASSTYSSPTARVRSASTARRGRMTAARTSTAGRLDFATRGSVSSMHSSRQNTPRAQGPGLRRKRGVDFSHLRARSTSAGRVRSGRMSSYASDRYASCPMDLDRPGSPGVPEVPTVPSSYLPKPKQKPTIDPRYASEIFREELRHFSSNIAKDCDEAFRSSVGDEDSIAGSLTDGDRTRQDSTPFSHTIDPPEDTLSDNISSVHSRPLPPLPTPNEHNGVRSLAPTAMDSRPTSRESHIVEQVDVALPVFLTKHTERRVVSAPTQRNKQKEAADLPAINETGNGGDKARIVSAPPHTPTKKGREIYENSEYLARVENTIRVVHSPNGHSPVKAPEPLNVRKKVVNGVAGRTKEPRGSWQPLAEMKTAAAAAPAPQGAVQEVKKKKSLWFKRSSKSESNNAVSSVAWQDCSSVVASSDSKKADSVSERPETKKKTFSLPFWKSNKPRDLGMSIERATDRDEVSYSQGQATAKLPKMNKMGFNKWDESTSDGGRNIEVKQSWLARLFRVKPALSHLCMTISRRRARQEVVVLLRAWRKYGIRGIQVDKRRNLIFARVGVKNHLDLKEVSFAAEIMTVIEHGKKQPLSIVQFTQERGAASSFHKVVDTMKVVFESRGVLVTDRNKEKMMIKTLNA